MLQPVVYVALLTAALTGGSVPHEEPGDCTRSGPARDRIAACSQAIISREVLGGDLAAAYRLRGLAHRDAGDYRGAIADYNQALRLHPENAGVLFERAGAYTSLREFDRAIADYDHSLQIDPDNSRAYFLRGVSYYQLGEHPRAIDDYGNALRIDPEFSPVYNERAWVLYLVGRYSDALEDADRALTLRPGMAPALDTRGHVLTALGRPDEALDSFERAIDAGGQPYVRLYQRALARHGLYSGEQDGNYGAAVRDALVACLQEQCRLLN